MTKKQMFFGITMVLLSLVLTGCWTISPQITTREFEAPVYEDVIVGYSEYEKVYVTPDSSYVGYVGEFSSSAPGGNSSEITTRTGYVPIYEKQLVGYETKVEWSYVPGQELNQKDAKLDPAKTLAYVLLFPIVAPFDILAALGYAGREDVTTLSESKHIIASSEVPQNERRFGLFSFLAFKSQYKKKQEAGEINSDAASNFATVQQNSDLSYQGNMNADEFKHWFNGDIKRNLTETGFASATQDERPKTITNDIKTVLGTMKLNDDDVYFYTTELNGNLWIIALRITNASKRSFSSYTYKKEK